MYAPTLLIGLGGLGSSIVQAVYARVPEARRPAVRVHILDTDVQELQDPRYRGLLREGRVTQTSPPKPEIFVKNGDDDADDKIANASRFPLPFPTYWR